MSNIDYYKSEIERYSKQIVEEQQNEDRKTLAENVYKCYSAFLDAGFSEEQAWWFAGTLFNKAVEIVANEV